MSKLKVGDRVRLKARLLNGYKGEATVLLIDHQDGLEDLTQVSDLLVAMENFR